MVKFIAYTLIALVLIIAGCHLGHKSSASKAATAKFVPRDTMDEQEFWNLIGYSLNDTTADDAAERANLLSKTLSQYTPKQIVEFELLLQRKIITANDYKIMAAEKIMQGSVSDDPYLYYRCWLIGQGQKTYTETLKNPDYLAKVVVKGTETDFEPLLYVSTVAYKSKTGKTKEDDSFPRDIAFKQGLDYDFTAPKTTGAEWKESDLPKLYPALWKLYN